MGIKNMPENLQDSEKSTTFALANKKYRGVEQLVARQAHNLEVACSSPASATNKSKFFKEFRLFYFHNIVFTNYYDGMNKKGIKKDTPEQYLCSRNVIYINVIHEYGIESNQ